jgi:hypothetical protein
MKMRRIYFKYALIFLLGMFTLAIGYLVLVVFGGIRRPTPLEVVEDYGMICFWNDDQGKMQASISPKGCFSPTCTRIVNQSGSAVIDKQRYEINFFTSVSLVETSRFLLPCVESCSGGGLVQLDLGELPVGQYDILFRDDRVGELNIFSGLPTPRQCIENADR